jgi:hypothetical protein
MFVFNGVEVHVAHSLDDDRPCFLFIRTEIALSTEGEEQGEKGRLADWLACTLDVCGITGDDYDHDYFEHHVVHNPEAPRLIFVRVARALNEEEEKDLAEQLAIDLEGILDWIIQDRQEAGNETANPVEPALAAA